MATRWLTPVVAVIVLTLAGCSSVASYVDHDQLAGPTTSTVDDPSTTVGSSAGTDGDPGEADGSTTTDTAGDPTTETTSGDDSLATPTSSIDDSSTSTTTEGDDQPARAVVREPTIINRYPHDTSAFTQGLEIVDGVLIESVGLLGESGRRRVVPTTGEVSASVALPADLFGAGITMVDGTLLQVTWLEQTLLLVDPTTLLEIGRTTYEGEALGLCNLGDGRLAFTDGSDRLFIRDAQTFEVIESVPVTLDGAPVPRLNELECVNGRVWANVWLTSDILQIEPKTGEVITRIDASSLVPGDLGSEDVLNGIAFDPERGTFYVTGKRWSVLYEVDLGPVD